MDDLRNWLLNDEQPYDVGVHLYDKYAKNIILKSRFNNGSAFNFADKLHYELTKIGKANGNQKEIVIELPGEFIPEVKKPISQVVQTYLPTHKLSKKYLGKIAYSTPTSGKTYVSQKYENVIDFDDLLVKALSK